MEHVSGKSKAVAGSPWLTKLDDGDQQRSNGDLVANEPQSVSLFFIRNTTILCPIVRGSQRIGRRCEGVGYGRVSQLRRRGRRSKQDSHIVLG